MQSLSPSHGAVALLLISCKYSPAFCSASFCSLRLAAWHVEGQTNFKTTDKRKAVASDATALSLSRLLESINSVIPEIANFCFVAPLFPEASRPPLLLRPSPTTSPVTK